MKHLSHTLYESTVTHQCTALLHNVGYSNTSEVCFGPNQLVTAKQSCDVVKDLSILQAQPKPEKGSSAYSSSEAMQALLQWRCGLTDTVPTMHVPSLTLQAADLWLGL